MIGASKIARDIREHKRLLHERQVAAANAEAARREVVDAQTRRLQEAARLKSEFVANMSHELRTPLNSIVGFAELIADARFGPLPDRYQEFARVMHSSAEHLLQLINDILDLAKVESGKIDFQSETVDLRQTIAEATTIVSGLAAKSDIIVTTDVDPRLASTAGLPLGEARERWLTVLEGNYLRDLLDRHDGNISAAAKAAGIDRKTFHRLVTKHQIR